VERALEDVRVILEIPELVVEVGMEVMHLKFFGIRLIMIAAAILNLVTI
jgi:hypothetical protein